MAVESMDVAGKDSNPVIRTVWTSEELWLRKKFNFNGNKESDIVFKVFHQFEADNTIYLNGVEIARSPEHSNAYTFIMLDESAKSLLAQGENILSVHCSQNGRRAYFDAGIYFMHN